MNDFFLDGVNHIVNGTDTATELIYDDDVTAPSNWDRVIEHIVQSPLSFKETTSIDNDAPKTKCKHPLDRQSVIEQQKHKEELRKIANMARRARNKMSADQWEFDNIFNNRRAA